MNVYLFVCELFCLALACQAKSHSCHTKLSHPVPNRLRKTVKVRITRATSLRYKNRPIKITMHLGLDIKINFKFTTNFDRCAILYVLNCCTKNFEPR